MSVQVVGWHNLRFWGVLFLNLFRELNALPEAGLKTRTHCHGNKVREFPISNFQFPNFVEEFREIFRVFPFCKVGDDPSPGAVGFDLRGREEFVNFELRRAKAAPRFHEGEGGFVAGGFDGEDVHLWYNYIIMTYSPTIDKKGILKSDDIERDLRELREIAERIKRLTKDEEEHDKRRGIQKTDYE